MKQKLVTALLFLGTTPAFAGVTDNNWDTDSIFNINETRLYGGYANARNMETFMLGAELTFNKKIWGDLEVLYFFEYHDSKYQGNLAKTYRGRVQNFRPDNNWFAFGPRIKKSFDNGLYLKGGVGGAYMKNRAYGRHISGGHWQFAPTASIGYNITKNVSLEYQWTHFSNAGTAKPNPGRDFHYITLGYSFK